MRSAGLVVCATAEREGGGAGGKGASRQAESVQIRHKGGVRTFLRLTTCMSSTAVGG